MSEVWTMLHYTIIDNLVANLVLFPTTQHNRLILKFILLINTISKLSRSINIPIILTTL